MIWLRSERLYHWNYIRKQKIKYIPSNILYNVIHMEYPISYDHNSKSFDTSLCYNILIDSNLQSQLNRTYNMIHLEYHMYFIMWPQFDQIYHKTTMEYYIIIMIRIHHMCPGNNSNPMIANHYNTSYE